MNVIALPTQQNVNELWESYAALNRRLTDNPKLLLDRDFCQRRAIAERQWKEAYLRWAK